MDTGLFRDNIVTMVPVTHAVVLIACMSTGCSLLFSTSASSPDDADGGVDDADGAVDDVDGSTPTLEEGEVWEGTGAAVPGESPDLSRPHLLVVRGSFDQDAILTLEAPGAIEVGTTVVSSNGILAATTVRVPVMLDLAEQDEPLRFNVLAAFGSLSEPTALLVRGLDELTLAGTLDVAELRGLYSKIEVQNAKIVGAKPARLLAISHIDVGGLLSVSAAGTIPGAGGCAGGQPGSSAPPGELEACSGGGQRGGLTNGGGGGGGHRDSGSAGLRAGVDDLSFGQPGQASGNAMLLPLSEEGGNGGGGSGGSSGGAGGAGGGVLELWASGPIRFSEGSGVRANGGQGGGALCAGNLGGGGGGSGGAILARTRSGFVRLPGASNELLVAEGGSGGGDSLCVGGTGSLGRLRADTPGANILGSGVEFGPMWDAGSPLIVTTPIVEFLLWGGPGRSYGTSVNRGSIKNVSIDGPVIINSTTVSLTLEAGANEVCVSADPSAQFSQTDAWNCIDVAYIPR